MESTRETIPVIAATILCVLVLGFGVYGLRFRRRVWQKTASSIHAIELVWARSFVRLGIRDLQVRALGFKIIYFWVLLLHLRDLLKLFVLPSETVSACRILFQGFAWLWV